MKKLFCVLSLLMLSALAFGGTNVPPCDPNNLPPNCTDYFGVANWAQSPLPAGVITGFTIKAAGSGYVNPVFTMTDPTGSGATAPTFTLVAGGLATVTGGGGGANYIAPQITIVDVGAGGTLGAPTCGGVGQAACGSGAVVLATIGAPLTPGTGIRKFQDTLTLPLANLVLATPDTTSFPGSDFYAIGLFQYTTKMHTDLPPTTLRGYCQLTATSSYTTCATGQPSYLGPVILASKNTPVRVLFKNMLPLGTGGNLFIPMDTTYMGAGAPYAENRATLHLHGGATPWISDGTPHQWTTPNGEAGPARGDSVQFVPDMWFDPVTHALVPAGTPSATNDPGPGNLTFFWTNQQGARLMFYHDHAYGITRLNVYAGEAAGYLLTDSAEDTGLAAATVPIDLAHLVPLVIQDKTFVPSAAQLAVEDPTWTAGGFGTTPGAANPGDLWFPHVYTTNQNPADPGGANAFGRWDYGPWLLPGNQTILLAANPTTAVTIPCTSSAFPNQAVQCPITPNPSGTPEAFMDTPLVNGKAYPVLHVAPAAYRFHILVAGNDRSLNLSWYTADPTVTTVDGRTNTEVKMLPAVQPTGAAGTLPLCTQITPITNTALFMGLATALFDTSGNPLNGTGLPAGCWPNYGAGSQAAGIPVQQTMWAADGRAGGVPDPTTAGPPWIEIGTEGGLLPAPVVIPAMPVGYEANTRSVTITNVSVHGLWLGPAERADAIVDFSKFAGKTLILYNDAPTPAPATDSRLDYFTGDGDQTPIGGAPNTLAGFGPNTRTIMQVIVDASAPNTTPFSLSLLQGALPSVFAQTQPVPIVPEPTYPPASGGYSPTLSYSHITDPTLTWTPIGSITPVTYPELRKTIQELFSVDYGRMNATLGVELPLTNFLTQTTIPLAYIDPVTEVINSGDTQLWHITHNGVDTHFIHFHLFNVQVINRSGWDGTVRPIDQNEMGWKDTVRMNPLEDILVAIKPIQPLPPFPVRDSYRLMDVTMPLGSDCPAPVAGASPLPCSIFTDVDPILNNPFNTPNKVVNFGWEYVWHCHILGHEENDMMRAIAFNVPPEAPSGLTVAAAVAPALGLNLTFTDNSASETGFTLQRDVTAAFASPTAIPVGPSTPTDPNGQGITWGNTITYNDASATGAGPYFYRVQAFKPEGIYWTASAAPLPPPPTITSAWSNTASFGATTSVSPTVLAFLTVPVTTTSTAQTVTLSNAGTATVNYTLSIVPAGQFAVSADPCAGIATAGANCAISVTFTPAVAGAQSASLLITTTDLANPNFTVSLTGTGGTAMPLLTITANNTTMKYGGKIPVLTTSYSPANPAGLTTPPTCTTTATSTSPVGMYPITCLGAVDASYTIAYVAGTVTVTPVPLTIWASNATMLAGSTVPAILPLYVGFVAGDSAATLIPPPTTSPYVAPTCSTTATSTSPVGLYPSSCSGAKDANYTISYVNGTVTVNTGVLTITALTFTMQYGGPIPTLTPTYSVNGVPLTPPALPNPPFTAPVCNTSVTVKTPVGTYPGAVICSGAVDPNYTITYVAGNVTITPAPLVITAPSLSMTYGGPLPTLTPAYATFVAGDTAANLTTQPTCTTTATVSSPVGTYPVNCIGAVDPNYAISYVAGILTITPKAASVTPNAASKVYGTADPVPLTTGTLTGFLPADGVTATYSRIAGETVAGNPYTITATLSPVAVLTNYTITYNTANFTITQAPASVTPNAASKAYGAADPVLTGTLAGFLPADNVTAVYARVPGETVAGSPYLISATLSPVAVLTNYAITYNTAPFTITPLAASVTPNAASKVYGTADPVFTGTLAGFLPADGVTATYSRTPGETVAGSPYTISAVLAPAGVLSNYTITYNTAAFTITPLAASVTPNAATKVYGTADPVFTGTLVGFLPADGVTATYSRTPGQTVLGSPYTISATLSPAAVLSNYTITYNTAAFTITPAAASVTPNAATKVYGTADPAFTGTLTGFLAADGVTATYSRTLGETVAGSPYTISALLAPAGVLSNYTIAYNTATFTITKAASSTTITSNVPSLAIIGQIVTVSFTVAPQFTGTPTGSVKVTASTGETCTGALSAGVGSCPLTFFTGGPRTLTATYGGDTNFLVSPASAPVTQVVSGISLSTFSLLFGDQLVGTTSASQTVTLSNVGTTTITISSITWSANFSDSTNCGTSLAPGRSCRINVRFRPTTTGVLTGTLTIVDSDPTSPQIVRLTGTGVAPINSVSPSSMAFGPVTRGTVSPSQTATVANTGTANLTVNGISLGGTNPGQFVLLTDTCAPFPATVPPGGQCTVAVSFRPTSVGAKSAVLNVRVAAPATNAPVTLTGTGQ